MQKAKILSSSRMANCALCREGNWTKAPKYVMVIEGARDLSESCATEAGLQHETYEQREKSASSRWKSSKPKA
ncbi:MAG: hypothetical protein KGR98_05115 [Verrucomicrobia bacterium]|nr:hypothetical protein [Verrucomicrobiota bacterium]MDE3099461.1 hypothetical protein [Verrucomicrobiota bacterium]